MSLNNQFYAQYPGGRRTRGVVGKVAVAALAVVALGTALIVLTSISRTKEHPAATTSVDRPATLPPYAANEMQSALLSTTQIGPDFNSTTLSPVLWSNAAITGCPAFERFWNDPAPSPQLTGEVGAAVAYATATNTSFFEESLGASVVPSGTWNQAAPSLDCPSSLTLTRENGLRLELRLDRIQNAADSRVTRIIDRTGVRHFTIFLAVARINAKTAIVLIYGSPGHNTPTHFLTLLGQAVHRAKTMLAPV